MLEDWEKIAELIDFDPMRAVRYGMACRYLSEMKHSIKVLDFGCGEGSGLKFMTRLGFKRLYGVEVSEERIKRAKSKLPSTVQLFRVLPDTRTLWKDNFFDVILSLAVIEHVRDKVFFLRELYRILKRNGKLILGSDCFTWKILQLLGLYRTVQPYDRTYTFTGYQTLFKRVGFKLLHFQTFSSIRRGSPYIGLLRDCFNLVNWNREDEWEEFNIYFKRNINNSYVAFLKERLFNFFNDENVFLLEKVCD